jgi:nicotinate-nucleotide pyrophosphorylase (carboxylating)
MSDPGRLEPALYRQLVAAALAEDIGTGDVTTAATVADSARGRGVLLAKADLVVAGLDIAREAFAQVAAGRDVRFEMASADGTACVRGTTIATVTGPAAALLTAERTALNFLQRLSGIATLTRSFVERADGRITVLDTRKTTPTLRALEKYAVRVGGGTNHRHGLYDMILIKDNHVRLAGGVGRAVEAARAQAPGLQVEVETQSLREVTEAVMAGADMILVDNLDADEVRDAVRRVNGRARVEVSGGVTLDRLNELAATGADCISVGALTHSAPAADISFEIEPA